VLLEVRPDRQAELPRLDSEALRQELAAPGERCVRARHRAGLLAHPQADLLPLDPGFAFDHRENLARLPVPLGNALRRSGVRACKAREALVAEVQHLALVLAGLADDFYPQVHLAVVEAGRPAPLPEAWPGSIRTVLLYLFDLPPWPGGPRFGARPGEGREGEAVVDLSPGSAAVLSLEPGSRVSCIPDPGNPGGRRLMVWVGSEREPDPSCGEGWTRLTEPEPVDVLLVSMPMAPVVQPSLGLALLKGTLPPGTAKAVYFGLTFARRIGRPLYHWISDHLPFATTLAGEWMFRPALYPGRPEDPRRYLDEVLLRNTAGWLADRGDERANFALLPDGLVEDMLAARELADGFVDWCAGEVLAHRPKVVGLTSVFQQQAASLALARRLKALSPATRIVLGGANCEGAMGLAAVRAFDCVDAVVSGEGEVILPRLVESWLEGRPIDDLQGVYTRTSPAVRERAPAPPNAPSPRHLDDLPYPDYDDFFAQFAAAGFFEGRQSRLLFETSRGCWWGERKHCTFCGLNGANMAYRSKSAERALDELRALTRRYPGRAVSTVDNILDMDYFKSFLPRLAEERVPVELFYEVKSNLRKDQIRLLRAAGVTSIQAGVESFSDPVLRLMGKGVKGLQNIRLLKWCRELEVWPYWNLLWGFPGEPPEEYARMAELIPKLHHLPPPLAMSPIFVERFSPNFFRSAEMGLADVRPMPAYRHIYDLPDEELEEMAFFFDHGYREPQDVAGYVRPVKQRMFEWWDFYGTGTLAVIDRGDHLLICDTRPAAVDSLTVLAGPAREVYLACDDIATVESLERQGGGLSRRQVEDILMPLADKGLLLREGETVLALAVAHVLDGRTTQPERR